ncbi:hypothetical protein F0241_20380 [Vibrio kanaloae]|nr:hypothetical protein [Vibrio kanaloae]
MARLYVLVNHRANKAFKSDSQRLAVSLRSSIAKRCSHLNAALVCKGQKSVCSLKALFYVLAIHLLFPKDFFIEIGISRSPFFG